MNLILINIKNIFLCFLIFMRKINWLINNINNKNNLNKRNIKKKRDNPMGGCWPKSGGGFSNCSSPLTLAFVDFYHSTNMH